MIMLLYIMDETIIWKIIDKYFEDNPTALVAHHLDSYNDFFNNGIKRIFKQKNPIKIMKELDEETNEYNYRCNIYLGGKGGDRIYFGKPIIYDEINSNENRPHFMYPNEARLRNMTYGTTIHFDLELDYFIKEEVEGEMKMIESTEIIPQIYLGKFPIMLNSELCILNKLDRHVKFNMGECKNDPGGYFIVDGKEKVIVCQEKFADNMLYIRDKGDDLYSHSAEVRSVSEDASKPVRTVAIKMIAPSPSKKNGQIVVAIPNVKKPIPLFIVMRALGIESDKDIIKYCLLDMDKYSTYVDLFIPSVHDAGRIYNQELALKYIASFIKNPTIPGVLYILTDYFLPHIGEMNFQMKAYYIGYMTKKLLLVYTKEEKATDRDSFKYKRVELSGRLLYDLFNEYYTLQQKHIFKMIDKKYYYNVDTYKNNFKSLIGGDNIREYFKERIVEEGFRRGFKGNWGSEEHTKKLGVVQPLNRLSYNSFIAHLRKINLPLDASAKVVGPRLLHGSQWGIIDPLDTPDGANCGLHKHMAITAKITSGCSGLPTIKWLRNYANMLFLEECNPLSLSTKTKVFVNGIWVGVVTNPDEVVLRIKRYRRCSLFPTHTNVQWNIENNEIFIYTDSGRMCRPIFYVDELTKKISYDKSVIIESLTNNRFTWNNLITGFSEKKDDNFSIDNCKLYTKPSDLYSVNGNDVDEALNQLNASQAIIEYIDTAESECALIAINSEQLDGEKLDSKEYTHLEIHPSLLLGVLGNQIAFPDNNPLPRDVFACGQSKQAISLYHSNYQTRIDKMGVVLNYGQIPLIKSRYMNYINNEEHPYGENVIVAIGVYGGYNVEDSILFNEASIRRGLFRTTYYSMYESREESTKVGGNTDSFFTNIEKSNVIGLKAGHDYSDLDEYGLVKENTELTDKKVVIGKVIVNVEDPSRTVDASEFPKKGQLGFVDKSFITEGEEGFRIAKVRVREEREPSIGDKFCSRCGQKGTVGLIIPERDMPFNSQGIRPDIIINPHALPSRMTIGQLVETLMGKTCAIYGGFGDCTAFVNKGPKNKKFGDMLTSVGFNSTGTEILYNGQSGEQLEANMYIGPTYYMRLKHMVKDKINYRDRGPRTALTRQPVQGRANDGGLRIGEMERDGLIAHGVSKFIQESMLVRGDDYYVAICNQTGTVAAYNESLNLFLSPMADGPIKFSNITETNANVVNISRYGREFSIIRVPYAFKLLMQELRTINVEMRVITEQNVDQLTNMSFSNNYNKLVKNDEISLSEIISKASGISIKKPISKLKKTLEKPLEKQLENLDANIKQRLDEDKEFEIPKIDIEQDRKNAYNFGWDFTGYDDEDNEMYRSLILDENGEAVDVWYTIDHALLPPDDYPSGWITDDLFYNDGQPIPPSLVIEELKKRNVPNNWKSSIYYIKNGSEMPEEVSPAYSPDTPPYEESPLYNPSTPPFSSPEASESPLYEPKTPDYAPPSSSPSSSPVAIQYAPMTMMPAVLVPVSQVQAQPVYVPTTPETTPPSLEKEEIEEKEDKTTDIINAIEKAKSISNKSLLTTFDNDDEKDKDNKDNDSSFGENKKIIL